MARRLFIRGRAVVIAYCWANGHIELGREMPEDTIEIARGGQDVLRHAIASTATAYPDGSFWVPDIPEPSAHETTIAALIDYLAWLATLDMGIQVNYPVESLHLPHLRTDIHGLKCASLHEALRLEFALDPAETELACLLLQKRYLPMEDAGVHAPETPSSFRTLLAKTGSQHLVDLMQRLASVA